MKAFGPLLLALLGFAPALVGPLKAQDEAVFVATYVEAVPLMTETMKSLLKAEAVATHADDGCEHVRALREIGQDNRFILLQVWADQSSYEAHKSASHVQVFQDRLGTIEAAPSDERVLQGFWLGPALNPLSADAIWVLTHVDVMPAYADQAAEILKSLGEASAKEPGNLRFAVTLQAGHANHLTVGEAWSDRMSFDAHLANSQTKDARHKLAPMLGALYDQRIYREID